MSTFHPKKYIANNSFVSKEDFRGISVLNNILKVHNMDIRRRFNMQHYGMSPFHPKKDINNIRFISKEDIRGILLLEHLLHVHNMDIRGMLYIKHNRMSTFNPKRTLVTSGLHLMRTSGGYHFLNISYIYTILISGGCLL